ncbi:kinase-like domain-containing protein [Dunaliella salina]|uniref:Kinase-like domain-containing protein n=1 Tax=Dunaliella salina TaxID=3046 RepID=A0ABQ7G012_DUNSA|nr:kinase-like domain-containing protein [Dunaliella salina]|eukprot:KAF5827936.1 kinase-like domain-containing protein [Dunaliella salina]
MEALAHNTMCSCPDVQEMFRNEDYSEKVDVFSFGVMLYEVIHRYLVICSISNEGTQEEIEDYAREVSTGYRPPLGDNWPSELRDLIRRCWDQDPSKRPSMDQVAQQLKNMLETGTVENMPAEAGCCVIQ